MDEVLTTLRDKLKNFSKGQQAEISEALFGKEQGPKMLALLNQTDEAIEKTFTAIRESGNRATQTRKDMDSFALTTKVLGGNFEVLTNQIGSAFIAVLDPLAKIINQFLTDISKLPKPIKDFGAGLAAAGIAALALKVTMVTLTALGVKALIFSKVAAAFVLFKKAIIGAKVAMIAFNLTNPLGWVALGIGGLTLAITKIIEFRKEIGNFFKSVRDGLYRYVVIAFNALPKFLREFLIGKNNRKAGDNFLITLPEVPVPKQNELKGDNVLDGGGIDEDTGNKQKSVLDGMKSAVTDYQEKVNDVAGNIKNAMSNAFQGMEDALVNFVMTGKLAFGDLARSIIQDMARIVIQQTIMAPFTGWIGKLLGNANGNAIVDGKVEKYAYGGIVSRPTVFPMKNGMGLMGEAGPEAIMPLKRGANGKLGVQSSGGVGNITVNVDASGTNVEGDETQGKQLGLLISAAVQTEIIQQQRPGGLLA